MFFSQNGAHGYGIMHWNIVIVKRQSSSTLFEQNRVLLTALLSNSADSLIQSEQCLCDQKSKQTWFWSVIVSFLIDLVFVNLLFSIAWSDVVFLSHTESIKYHLQQSSCQKHLNRTNDKIKWQIIFSEILPICKSSVKIFLV